MCPPPSQLQSSLKHGLQSFNINSARQLNIMLFGAPGVGKGTFGKLIQKDFKFKPFSTGDYFRRVIKMS